VDFIPNRVLGHSSPLVNPGLLRGPYFSSEMETRPLPRQWDTAMEAARQRPKEEREIAREAADRRASRPGPYIAALTSRELLILAFCTG
jgi:hypothetical protein